MACNLVAYVSIWSKDITGGAICTLLIYRKKEKKKEEEETISSKRSKLLNVLLNRSLERVRQDSLVCVTSYKASSSTETTSCSR